MIMVEVRKIDINIIYCVPCSYHGAVIGLMSEFYSAAGNQVAIKITPGIGGIFQVFLDGEKIYDKAGENGKFPDVPRIKEMKALIKNRLAASLVA
jgi:selT/selW/selH-like putative selenoprotein